MIMKQPETTRVMHPISLAVGDVFAVINPWVHDSEGVNLGRIGHLKQPVVNELIVANQ